MTDASTHAQTKPHSRAEARRSLMSELAQSRDRLVELCRALVGIDSQNPPGDTTAVADFIEKWIGRRDGVEVRRVTGRAPVVNLVVRMPCGGAGPRLALNAHMDTFPIGDASAWTMPPLSGLVRDGRIYGRGVSDMKAGLAAALIVFDLLWPRRHCLDGELVLTLVGDEETGGAWGTDYLLEHVPDTAGDMMLNADVGSPRVVRFGEKGYLWFAVEAVGRPGHGAHVHLGVNAIERLTGALARLAKLRDMPVPMADDIAAAMAAAAPVSESVSGAGEHETLRRVTMNIGTIGGGAAVNIIADRARATVDMRLPPGLAVDDLLKAIRGELADLDGVSISVLGRCEPNWTDPAHPLVQRVTALAAEATGVPAVANMRLGLSDARLFRQRGVPSVVYGPTPHNMGGPDEYVLIDEAVAVLQVHALAAFDTLSN